MPPEDYWSNLREGDDDWFLSQIKAVRRLLDADGRIRALDIGAGVGLVMRSLRAHGFDVWGLEPSPTFHARALTNGVDPQRLQLAKVEEADYPLESFDFITYGAVFEHLAEPSRCLSRSLAWLRPGGIIHMEVPSSRWLIAAMINVYYRLTGTTYVTNLSPMHPPYHLFEFDLKSFQYAGTRLGFEVAEHQYDVCDVMFAPSVAVGLLAGIMKATDSGMQLTVYLRKSS